MVAPDWILSLGVALLWAIPLFPSFEVGSCLDSQVSNRDAPFSGASLPLAEFWAQSTLYALA